MDAAADLDRAPAVLWPDMPVQRQTVHNLPTHVPGALHEKASAGDADIDLRRDREKGGTPSQDVSAQVVAELVASLALQLRYTFQVRAPSDGLVDASPERPSDDVRGADAPLGEPGGDASDFLDRPSDEGGRVRGSCGTLFGGGAWFA